jgi:hypothetical protein
MHGAGRYGVFFPGIALLDRLRRRKRQRERHLRRGDAEHRTVTGITNLCDSRDMAQVYLQVVTNRSTQTTVPSMNV